MTQTPTPPGLDPHAISQRRREPYPSLAWVMRKPARIIAFGFGSGLIRPASGTWGTLAAWLLWVAAEPFMTSFWGTGLFIALAFVYGCWACDQVGRELNVSDHLGMVWDEIVAFWLVLWLSPPGWWPGLVAFVLFRLFDIVKPPPIKYCDARIKGGVGVMADDILAAVYAIAIMLIATHFGVFGSWST